MNPSKLVIEARDLRMRYTHSSRWWSRRADETLALQGVNLAIPAGTLFGLLGPNGAGKTTTLRIFTTLLLPTSGSARVLGHDVATSPRAIRPLVGFAFGGDRGLYSRLSGRENLMYFTALYGLDSRNARQRTAELLEMFRLAEWGDMKVEHYSRGMRQRLHIARSLIHDPQVLFLDEPTIGLDPVSARDVRMLIQALPRLGKTVFLTTHYLLEAENMCDSLAVLSHGRIVAEGEPNALKRLVANDSVIELRAQGLTERDLARLRTLRGVSAVTVATTEMLQTVTLHCSDADALAMRVRDSVPTGTCIELRVRPVSLEDAYMLLASE